MMRWNLSAVGTKAMTAEAREHVMDGTGGDDDDSDDWLAELDADLSCDWTLLADLLEGE